MPDPSQPAPTATESLYRAALAEGDVAHYLPVFMAFDERGVSGARWNPAAALLHLNWLLYRRLWRAAALHALAVAASAALIVWAVRAGWVNAPGVQAGLWLALVAGAVAVPGFWGHAWLHDDVRRRMTAAVRRARTVQEACDVLQRAPRHRWTVGVAALMQIGLFVAAGVGLWGTGTGAPPLDPPPDTAVPVAVPSSPASRPPAIGEAPPAPPPPERAAAAQAVLPEPGPVVAGAALAPVESAETPRPRLRGHGVNVGLFGHPANAERAARRLRDAGLPVVTDAVESARGPLTRVRVGPFDDAASARQAADQVRALGLEARPFGP